MNCTIWRSMSMSAPFSASSFNAIVAVVIVISFVDYRFLGRTSTLSGTTMATPSRNDRRAASRFGLRPQRLAAHQKLTPLPGTSTTQLKNPCLTAGMSLT